MMFDVPSVSVADLDREPPDTVLLDVREKEEWVAGHAEELGVDVVTGAVATVP